MTNKDESCLSQVLMHLNEELGWWMVWVAFWMGVLIGTWVGYYGR